MDKLTLLGLGLMGAGVATKLIEPPKMGQSAEVMRGYGALEIVLIGGGASLAFYGAFVKGKTPMLTSGPPSSYR
jgi:hypothetical protein